MTVSIRTLTGALLVSLCVSPLATAEQPARRQAADDRLPLCREAGPGEICRNRNGQRMRRPPARTGPDESGFIRPEVDDEVITGFVEGDPDRPVVNGRVMNREDAPAGFGGQDLGGTNDGGGNEPLAMESEFSDDDDDEPQPPVNNKPTGPRGQSGAGGSTSSEPAEEDPEDCVWTNPAEGPDQEFCDE